MAAVTMHSLFEMCTCDALHATVAIVLVAHSKPESAIPGSERLELPREARAGSAKCLIW